MVGAFVLVLAAAVALSALLAGERSSAPFALAPLEGRDEQELYIRRPTVEAAFAMQSYRPGAVARLLFFDTAAGVRLRVYRIGAGAGRLPARDVLRGTRVGPDSVLARVRPGETVRLRLGASWRTGLYYAELTAPGGRIGYAPFVLAPRRLGEHRIAVVLPTQTWQAYNFRDDDGNGTADTWYALDHVTNHARLFRPFQNRGIPQHFRYYDEPFLRWLERSVVPVDFISDAELDTVSAATLARDYQLLVFEGHHEYVTGHEFDAVTGFRDRGGNLLFLSANTFFYKITVDGDVMTRGEQWRNLGRPEAALVGAAFFGYDAEAHGGAPWIIRDVPATRWIFRGTRLGPGSPFASGGIEADHTSPASPRGTQVVAEIPNIWDRGTNAQMTYYRAPSGAEVVAAGAFSLATAVWQPPVRIVMVNLIERLAPGAGWRGADAARGTPRR
jgi:hypothetical protein